MNPPKLIHPPHFESQKVDACGLGFIGLFSQDPPCFLFTARLGCSRDSQGTHVAMSRCAACKQGPGLTCVYPTTLIGYGCVPPILPPLKQVSAVTVHQLTKVGGGISDTRLFLWLKSEFVQKISYKLVAVLSYKAAKILWPQTDTSSYCRCSTSWNI